VKISHALGDLVDHLEQVCPSLRPFRYITTAPRWHSMGQKNHSGSSVVTRAEQPEHIRWARLFQIAAPCTKRLRGAIPGDFIVTTCSRHTPRYMSLKEPRPDLLVQVSLVNM